MELRTLLKKVQKKESLRKENSEILNPLASLPLSTYLALVSHIQVSSGRAELELVQEIEKRVDEVADGFQGRRAAEVPQEVFDSQRVI